MNDFDRFLETGLQRMLDPVVATRPPVRGRRRRAPKPVLVVVPAELVPVTAEAMPVAVAVAPLPQ